MTNDIKKLNKIKEQYLYSSVNFEGNEEVETFYGHVSDIKFDTDGSIYVTLVDMEDNYFDIDWTELENCEFDFDEYIEG